MARLPTWRYDPAFKYQALRRIATFSRPVQLMSCAALALGCLLLAGCSSPNFLRDVYIASFSLDAGATTAGFSRLEVRVGYFSLCLRTGLDATWICGDPDWVREHFRGVVEPWNLLKTAYDLRNEAISPSLCIISAASNLLSIFLVSSFPFINEPPDKYKTLWVANRFLEINSWCGVMSSLLAALWQHTMAATSTPLMTYLSSGEVTTVVGPAATTLVWLGFGFTFVTGFLCLKAAYALLRRPKSDWLRGAATASSVGSRTDVESVLDYDDEQVQEYGEDLGQEYEEDPSQRDDAAMASGALGGFPEADRGDEAAVIEMTSLPAAGARHRSEERGGGSGPAGP